MDARQLRAALSTIGMSYAELARRADVNERSVKRWASPSAPWDVPDDIVTDIIEPEMARQDAMVEACLQVVEAQEAEHGEPNAVQLPWYLGFEELEARHGAGRTVDMANADTLRVYSALKALGYKVEIVGPHEF